MRLLLSATLIFSSILIDQCCQRGNDWQLLWQSSNSDAAGYTDIYFFDDKIGIVAGLGEVRKSTDGGSSWVEAILPEKATVSGFINDGNRMWAVGAREGAPSVFFSDDQGNRWSSAEVLFEGGKFSKPGFSLFYQGCLSERGDLVFVGNRGIVEGQPIGEGILITAVFETEYPVYSVACDSQSKQVVATGSGGMVYRRLDGWSSNTVESRATLYTVRLKGGKGWLTGSVNDAGVLFESDDGGETWARRIAPSLRFPSLYDIFLVEKNGWVVGAGGAILQTSDAGKSWQEAASPSSNDLQRIFALDANNVWIVGNRATVMKLK